jgi:hypothetical protein
MRRLGKNAIAQDMSASANETKRHQARASSSDQCEGCDPGASISTKLRDVIKRRKADHPGGRERLGVEGTVNGGESGQKPSKASRDAARILRARMTRTYQWKTSVRPPDDLKLHLSPPSTVHMCSSLREEMSGGRTSPGKGRNQNGITDERRENELTNCSLSQAGGICMALECYSSLP